MKPLDLAVLREAVAQGRIQWRKHLLQKLAERGISQQAVRDVLSSGERIRDYAEDRPFPSALFLGYVGDQPLHVMASCDEVNKQAFIITAYEPSLDVLESGLSDKEKTMGNIDSICPLCGGKKTAGKTTFSADLGSGIVVVREVEATVCSQCGEEWIDDTTARKLEQIVKDARARRLQVEVAAM